MSVDLSNLDTRPENYDCIVHFRSESTYVFVDRTLTHVLGIDQPQISIPGTVTLLGTNEIKLTGNPAFIRSHNIEFEGDDWKTYEYTKKTFPFNQLYALGQRKGEMFYVRAIGTFKDVTDFQAEEQRQLRAELSNGAVRLLLLFALLYLAYRSFEFFGDAVVQFNRMIPRYRV